jgi:hypothetical protein
MPVTNIFNMFKLSVVSLSTETLKPVKKEFDSKVALLSPQITEGKTQKGIVKSSKVSAGSLCLNKEAVKALNLSSGNGEVSISESNQGLFIYNSTSLKVSGITKKGLTKTGVLRLSEKNYKRIMTDNSLDPREAWYFVLEECLVDLPGEDNVKAFVFKPLEKRAS